MPVFTSQARETNNSQLTLGSTTPHPTAFFGQAVWIWGERKLFAFVNLHLCVRELHLSTQQMLNGDFNYINNLNCEEKHAPCHPLPSNKGGPSMRRRVYFFTAAVFQEGGVTARIHFRLMTFLERKILWSIFSFSRPATKGLKFKTNERMCMLPSVNCFHQHPCG